MTRAYRAIAAPLIAALSLLVTACGAAMAMARQAGDPLPSWNDGPTKRAILEFVGRVTAEGGPDYVPPAERIATFDNDGTLWVEKPLPNEVFFILARVKEMAAKDPGLRDRQPFKAALTGDAAYFQKEGAKAVVELLGKAYGGMTQEDFAADARRFLTVAQHPTLKRPLTETRYRPMMEVLEYLREKGFQTWICSGGSVEFMRVFSQQTYGIPPQQVIGSTLQRRSEVLNGRRVVWRDAKMGVLNDKEVKPVSIDGQIGRRPLFVAGNVGGFGDVAMMEYSKGRPGPSFQLLINHDDAAREFAYAEKDNGSLSAAAKNGFTVVSIKNDWKEVFYPTGPMDAAAGTVLESTDWLLREVNGKPLPALVTGAQGAAVPALRFTADGRVTGYTTVNLLSGTYEADPAARTLKFGPLATTRRAGPPEAMATETAFQKALAATASYRLTGPTLELLDSSGGVVARLTATPAESGGAK
jgi:heat shock protein HslJ/phosphoserine phosphatase